MVEGFLVGWVLLGVTAVLAANVFVSLVGFAVLTADAGIPRAVDVRLVALVARESAIRSLFLALSPFGTGQPRPRRAPVEGGAAVPVVLLPGYGQNRAALMFLRTFLVHRGHAWVWPVNVGRREGTLAEMATTLGARVDELRAASGAEQVDVVAHSLGGLAAAWYVRHQGGASKVRRLVTLGTPWRGTKLAVFGRRRVAREALPSSPELDALAPPAVPTIAVWSDDDPIVVPTRNALPDGAESVRVDTCGHVEMLASARVFRAVHAALALGTPGEERA